MYQNDTLCFPFMSTPVVIQEDSQRSLYRQVVRDGVSGNYDVVYEMIRLIRDGVNYDKGVEDLIKGIVVEAHQDSYTNNVKILQTVFNFVKLNVKYVQDIAGRIESLKDARATISDGFGDCDDHTVLNCTLLGDLGFEDVRVAMARLNLSDQVFGHVYCVVYTDGKRIAFDTSLPDTQLDAEVESAEVKEIGVFTDVPGLDGISGLYNQLRYNARNIAREGIKIIPNVVNFLPLGFLAGNAFATGAALLNQSTEGNYSVSATASQINKQLDQIILDLLSSKVAWDMAKTQALQVAANMAALDTNHTDKYPLQVAAVSIKSKLDFIRNFDQYAKAHDIELVHLNPQMMLAAGVGVVGLMGYWLYRNYIYRG